MTSKLKRGWGGRKDIIVLGVIAVVGVVIILVAQQVRRQVVEPTGVVTTALAPAEMIRLGDKARGPARIVAYHERDLARVVAPAVAHRLGAGWQAVPAGAVLRVVGVFVEGSEVWLSGIAQGQPAGDPVRLHASFTAPYNPVLLERTIELADVRLLNWEASQKRLALNAWLRNVSDQTISQCVVTCIFQDSREQTVDTRRTEPLVLRSYELTPFQVALTEQAYASIALQIAYATPDGLRNYLPTVVIKKSSL